MKVITIMPDFDCTYAWLKEEDEGTVFVGGLIGDSSGFWDPELEVSPGLQQSYCEWVLRFNLDCYNSDFDWKGFHEEGIALTRRLKSEFGDKARVMYVKPCEDPARILTERY